MQMLAIALLAATKLLIGVGHVALADGKLAKVSVDELSEKPREGRYLLLGTRGRVATLELLPDHSDRVRDGWCVYRATFTATAEPATFVPADADPVVVVGPLNPPGRTGKERLLPEPTGVPVPADDLAQAVDLDGDGQADLALHQRTHYGRFVKGFNDIDHSIRVLTRAGRRWTATSRCTWVTHDTIR